MLSAQAAEARQSARISVFGEDKRKKRLEDSRAAPGHDLVISWALIWFNMIYYGLMVNDLGSMEF